MRLAIGIAAALAALACGSGADGNGTAAGCTEATAVETTSVALAGTSFAPACVKVRTGVPITFTAADAQLHTVTADGGQTLGGQPVTFGSGNLSLGETFTQTFAAAGTVNVHCAFHVAMGMRARIFVHD